MALHYLSGVVGDVHSLFQFLFSGLQKLQFFVNFLYFLIWVDETFEE